jgi:hypothetical protein
VSPPAIVALELYQDREIHLMPNCYILKVIFRSPTDFFLLYASDEEQQSFREALENCSRDRSQNRFWPVYTLDGKVVLVNLAQIRICHFLDAIPDEIPTAPAGDDAAETILVGIEGTDEPFKSATDAAESLYELFCDAEAAIDLEQGFISYFDDDNEEVYVSLRHMTYLQAPAALVEEGRQMALSSDA